MKKESGKIQMIVLIEVLLILTAVLFILVMYNKNVKNKEQVTANQTKTTQTSIEENKNVNNEI